MNPDTAPTNQHQALYAVVMEAYVHGISTHAVDELVEAMGVEAGHSYRDWFTLIAAGSMLNRRVVVCSPVRISAPGGGRWLDARSRATPALGRVLSAGARLVVAPGTTFNTVSLAGWFRRTTLMLSPIR